MIRGRMHTDPARPRTFLDFFGLGARGFCMGAADVVPGVSGGTMAFILGIYEELIDSFRAFARRPFLTALFRFQLREAAAAVNLSFLLSVGIGILTAILTLAKGIEWLLEHEPVLIWSFFFGLVLASVVTVAARIKRWTILLWIALIAGTVARGQLEVALYDVGVADFAGQSPRSLHEPVSIEMVLSEGFLNGSGEFGQLFFERHWPAG